MPEQLIEHEITMPVCNPDSSGVSRSFEFAGRIDHLEPVPDGNGTFRVIDYKSTGNPHRTIAEKTIGFQAELYALAAQQRGMRIVEMAYRLIQTPGIKFVPKKDGDWTGYEERCVEWFDDPEHPDRLMEHPISINPARLAVARAYLWDCSQRVLEARRPEGGRWLPNENGCWTWNKPCPFLPLCEALAAGSDAQYLIDQDYEVQSEIHPELSPCPGNGCKRRLTYTSCSALTLCEQKYFWLYELGIRKKRQYDEAPWLGSAMHVGIEAYRKGLSLEGARESAYRAIDDWKNANPAFGEGVDKVLRQVCKARAMVRAAMARWPIHKDAAA